MSKIMLKWFRIEKAVRLLKSGDGGIKEIVSSKLEKACMDSETLLLKERQKLMDHFSDLLLVSGSEERTTQIALAEIRKKLVDSFKEWG